MSKTLDADASAFAEYSSLPQEIATREDTQNTILTFQITIAGALYSFALSLADLGFLGMDKLAYPDDPIATATARVTALVAACG